MKRLYLFTLVLLAILVIAGCSQKDAITPTGEDALSLKSASIAGKYIVVLKDDVSISKADLQTRKSKVQEKAFGLLKKYEVAGEIEEVYETALQGFTVKMAPGQAKKLELDPNVGYIEADKVVTLSPIEMNGKPGGGGTTQPAQVIPWGITRVGGGIDPTNSSAYSTTHCAWIIDTGVDMKHPDLNVDQIRGKSFVSRVTSPNDDNGHGSHVAGIIAANMNTIGVVGVAAGALVVPVKVLDRNGSGSYSAVIAGVNYVAGEANDGDVVNMSLGGGFSQALNDAVIKASDNYPQNPHKDIYFALAAGNESTNANTKSPASANGQNIYTVSAMGIGDKWASYSNFGNPPVDYCAPGSSIYSTYKTGGYATMSGTSMAAPHVAGLLLIGNIITNGYVSGDRDTYPDPIAHH